jgi:deoxyribonuclease-4
MSIAGGLAEAMRRGLSVGCDCVQIFTKSARQWKAKPYSAEEVAEFKAARAECGIKAVIAHASYLLNLGAGDETLRRRSVAAIVDELERCEALEVGLLVTHPGAHVGTGEKAGIAAVARSIGEAHKSCPGFKARIALENTAGQGSTLGYTFEQLGAIISAVREGERVALCFDTQHAFAAGYDLRGAEGYERAFQELDRAVELKRLAAFHLNDSPKPLGARVDRHEHIGRGLLGLETFARLLNDRRFAGLPMCLETPKGPDMREDVENLATLRRLFDRG